jgi:phytol kinase
MWQTWVVGIPVALGATAIELFAQWGLDNLTVPIGSAALVLIVNQFLIGI